VAQLGKGWATCQVRQATLSQNWPNSPGLLWNKGLKVSLLSHLVCCGKS